jgi:hypothetical protein
LHLFESCDVFLAGRIPDCGGILQDRSNHGLVRRCLDGGGALAEVAPQKAYSNLKMQCTLYLKKKLHLDIKGNLLYLFNFTS